jgi:predicted ATPase
LSIFETKPYVRSIKLLEGFDESVYPFTLRCIRSIGSIELHKDVTFFVGENGSGKSTLLEAIAVHLGLGPEGGTKNSQFQTANTVSTLHNFLRISKNINKPTDQFFLRAESFYNLATYMDGLQREHPASLDSYGGVSLHAMSHGESFLRTMLTKFQGNGIYLLDEPEAALSPARQLAALVRIHDLVTAGSQFIIATHSPILLSYPSSLILQFTNSVIEPVSYEQTENYAITKRFLNNYKVELSRLLVD